MTSQILPCFRMDNELERKACCKVKVENQEWKMETGLYQRKYEEM